jgi:hypothetical protein
MLSSFECTWWWAKPYATRRRWAPCWRRLPVYSWCCWLLWWRPIRIVGRRSGIGRRRPHAWKWIAWASEAQKHKHILRTGTLALNGEALVSPRNEKLWS